MPTKRRVFLGIPCPEHIRARIAAFQKKWGELPVRWIPPENLHVTVVPPNYLSDDEIAKALRALRGALSHFEPFTIKFERFVTAPPGRPTRMLWLLGTTSQELMRLRDVALNALLDSGIAINEPERRPLLPHITVARMRPGTWRRLQPPPPIEEEVDLVADVTGIALMESIRTRFGREYPTLEFIPFL
jgi:2'-5' RNA ligase